MLKEKITLCGDNCIECPRYNAHSYQELTNIAELWYKIGWRDTVVPSEKMVCTGCSSHKKCTYQLIECTQKHDVIKCNQCNEFPCIKINDMLKRSMKYQQKCKMICSQKVYTILEKAFFNKEANLKK